ncbi:Serine/threonine-protein kinase haspin [Beauveria bassiana D1-5]|uniref:non-specific serine/threonine protein kinase n=1 Tax=Beauveria bassiana D1-5 TaxID=1245745 RepID=A0A0A2VVV0_BEABA|nr:Serine/threonine-protein kinase haspin [Beauveria bassiana D1-5]
MARKATYGKRSKASKAERLFAELPQSPMRKPPTNKAANQPKEPEPATVRDLTERLSEIRIQDKSDIENSKVPRLSKKESKKVINDEPSVADEHEDNTPQCSDTEENLASEDEPEYEEESSAETTLRILTWEDVCPYGDRIEKIAEASYAEVYRVTNDRGTSIIKVIRLNSPIKAKTKMQERAKLVDEEPHSEEDINGELQISEWLADIPGFVVYKERYVVQGKATRQLLETHQVFQRRMKRQDPGRAQFYPSPSRYLDDTRFLVVELGDAGIALEGWKLTTESQLWDIFFLVAVALARAEDLAMFEHRDLHEGNLCIRQAHEPSERPYRSDGRFYGYSGLDITILDYGLSRAEDLSIDYATPVSNDLEKDLSFFTSTHAPQCNVYRQMRSFLLRADRVCLPPAEHTTPYAKGIDGPISWDVFAPYSNVLWLAYLYSYLVSNFKGDKKALQNFRSTTQELWKYLDPNARDDVPCFSCAADVVCFGVEAGWIADSQLAGSGHSIIEREESIIMSRDDEEDEAVSPRRLPRRSQYRQNQVSARLASCKKVLPDLEEQEYLYSWFLVGTRSFYYEIEETLSYPSHDRLALLPPGDRTWVATRGLASGGGVPEWDDWMHGKEDADGALAKARAMLPGFLARGDVEDYRRRITELRDDANAANMDVLLQRWNQLDELARANGRAKQQSRGKNKIR